MIALVRNPSTRDYLNFEVIGAGDETRSGTRPHRSLLAPFLVAATTLGATHFLPPSLAIPTNFSEIAPQRDFRRAVTVPRTASEKLARIRASLSLNVAELGRILKVERPTIYAWMRDDSVSLRPENRIRLDRLYAFAKRWETLSNLPIGTLVRETNDAGDSVASLLDIERYAAAVQLLEAMAERMKEAPIRRVPSLRKSLEEYGLADGVQRSQAEIDRVAR